MTDTTMTKPMELVEAYGEACADMGRDVTGDEHINCAALLSEIRQRLEAMERDAARYKRIRRGICVTEIEQILGRPADYDTEIDVAIDAAIDAAMAEACWCSTCRPVNPMIAADNRMVLCPDCGNKRCPRAGDHKYKCSGSNEPGQVGEIAAMAEGK